MSGLSQGLGFFSAPPEIKFLAGSSKSLSFLDPKNVVDKAFPGNPLAPVQYQKDETASLMTAEANKKKSAARASLDAQDAAAMGGHPRPTGLLVDAGLDTKKKTKLG